MLVAHNDYFPYEIPALSSVDVILETVVTRLPIFMPKVVVRSQEPVNSVVVTYQYQLEVAAPLTFMGTWTTNILDAQTLGPNVFLTLQPPHQMDGVYGRNRLLIQNPNPDPVLVHVLVTGAVEAVLAAAASTYVVPPV